MMAKQLPFSGTSSTPNVNNGRPEYRNGDSAPNSAGYFCRAKKHHASNSRIFVQGRHIPRLISLRLSTRQRSITMIPYIQQKNPVPLHHGLCLRTKVPSSQCAMLEEMLQRPSISKPSSSSPGLSTPSSISWPSAVRSSRGSRLSPMISP